MRTSRTKGTAQAETCGWLGYLVPGLVLLLQGMRCGPGRGVQPRAPKREGDEGEVKICDGDGAGELGPSCSCLSSSFSDSSE